ncbi:hypothetical protein, partial [Vibrio parahaemolyticus]|uniref:hypothetical protein n=1 Tax=Vibrio parahaemolyticus TaxID=670 RepID=UPI0009F05A12
MSEFQALVESNRRLAEAVENKTAAIDQRVVQAEKEIDQFMDGARDEFLIPNIPLPLAETWTKEEHLANDLMMTALPKHIYLKKYDSVNKKYEGEEGFASHDSFAPSNDLYPSGLIQIVNKQFGASPQRYFMAFMRFGHDVVNGVAPSTVVKIEGVKTDNNSNYLLATLNESNFYSNKRSKGFIGGSVFFFFFYILKKKKPNSFSSLGGFFLIYWIRSLLFFDVPIHTTKKG